jgi:hypothetical protein
MNGYWDSAWQGVENGANATAPAQFASAWRRVVTVFRREGASNVRWVFNPNTGNAVTHSSSGASNWNWWKNYYPGDDWVDYVGAHGYNAPRAFSMPYQDYTSLFYGPDADNMLRDMLAQLPNKPILLGEIAMEADARKPEWIRDAYDRMLADPRIAGAVWFNMKKEADWRVDSDPASLAAYRDALAQRGVATAYTEPALLRGAVVAMR